MRSRIAWAWSDTVLHVLGNGLLKPLELALIISQDGGVESYDLGGAACNWASRRLFVTEFERAGARKPFVAVALCHLVDDPFDFPVDLADAAPPTPAVLSDGRQLLAFSPDRFSGIRRERGVLFCCQGRHHPFLDSVEVEACGSGRLPLSWAAVQRIGKRPVLSAPLVFMPPQHAAHEGARTTTVWAPSAAELVRPSFSPSGLGQLRMFPWIRSSGPALRRFATHPGDSAGPPLPGVGVLDHPDLVPHQPSGVEVIAQDAGAALVTAVDRGGVPAFPASGGLRLGSGRRQFGGAFGRTRIHRKSVERCRFGLDDRAPARFISNPPAYP